MLQEMAWLVFQELLAQWIVTESTGGDAVLDVVWKCIEVFVELLLENQLGVWDHKSIHKFCAKIIGVREFLKTTVVGRGQGFILLELLKLINFILHDPH